ncbi:MAG: FlhC family transcriptional regulator [Methylococcaceae bacterium]
MSSLMPVVTKRTSTFYSSCSEEKRDQIDIAVRAAKFSVRPSLLVALAKISADEARKIFKSVTGTNPVKGQLPSDVSFYVADHSNHFESTWLVKAYKRLTIETDDHYQQCNCMLTAYEQYLETFPNPMLSFERFHFLIRMSCFAKEIKIGNCQECNSIRLIVKSFEYRKSTKCPVCNLAHHILEQEVQ